MLAVEGPEPCGMSLIASSCDLASCSNARPGIQSAVSDRAVTAVSDRPCALCSPAPQAGMQPPALCRAGAHLLVDSSLSLAEVLRDGRQHAVGVRRKRVVSVQLREELLHARSPLVRNSKHLHIAQRAQISPGLHTRSCRGGVHLLRDRAGLDQCGASVRCAFYLGAFLIADW